MRVDEVVRSDVWWGPLSLGPGVHGPPALDTLVNALVKYLKYLYLT